MAHKGLTMRSVANAPVVGGLRRLRGVKDTRKKRKPQASPRARVGKTRPKRVARRVRR